MHNRVDGAAIEVRGLTKRYGDLIAIDDFDMDIPKGESMGLVGPNGAGKSTILKSISGLISPTSGTILINGVDSRNHREAMTGVGCVIETPLPYPSYTPAEMLSYAGRMHGIPKEEIRIRSKDVLEDLRMWSWRDKRIGGFSKGMMQRVSIATALIHNPEIVLFDEPTSGLDPRGMIEMRQILQDLKRRGLTMVISTHMLGEISELCTSMTLIDHGRKVIGGRVEELLRRGQGVVIEVRLAKDITPGFMKDLSELPGIFDTEATGPRAFRARFIGTDEQQASIAELVQSHGLMILSMNETGEDLESFYMSHTNVGEDDAR